MIPPKCKMEEILIPDGKLLWWPDFYDETESEELLSRLRDEIEWRQDQITIFGKKVNQPRLVAWYGDPGASYAYSGLRMEPNQWTPLLQDIRRKIESACKYSFNSVLLNLYRDGQDSMGWHSDNEPELGQNPAIASLSLGQERVFHLKHKSRKDISTQKILLTSGSLLLMTGRTQHFWKHQIPKSKRSMEARINLTFRKIKS